MDPIPCPGCDSFFVPRNKLQIFCTDPDCQRIRKALWQKQKLACDPEYKKDQKLANQKWLQNTPDYWPGYRLRNPKKVDRNRSLQKIRNCKSQKNKAPFKASKTIGIAKMDSSKSRNQGLLGQYWLVPVVAKMDPVKIFIATAPVCSP
ncbi:MAG: hypothetical protein HOJ48_04640 [Desulfobacula sp.]|nr:hypothetical protein [Desulfobacula sp.]